MIASTTSSASRERGRFYLEAAVVVVLGLISAGVYWFAIRVPKRPNVIVISIDTLRPDHLSTYGYDKPTSPNIDSLAERGVQFQTVHSSSTWTLPAHLSLMTGLPDFVHGVRHDLLKLDENRRMMAELFQREGYRTAGYFGGPYLSAEFGFKRGFGIYENCGVPTREELALTATSAEDLNKKIALMEQQSHQVRTAERTEDAVEAFLDEVEDDPFFLFIHHWDVHYDFNPPEAYVKMFAPNYRGNLDLSNFMFNPAIHAEMAAEDYAYVIANYDAEIRWVDFQIGRLLNKLEELGLAEDTYIVITGDHGEEFFEHGNKGHRYNLHEETLRIPLIIAGPKVRSGVKVDEPARIFDILPTLLEMAGLPAEPEVYGLSLAPFLVGEGKPRNLPLIAELTYIPKIPDPESAEGWRVADYYFDHRATSRNGMKRIDVTKRRFDDKKPWALKTDALKEFPPQVYNLRLDPKEATPIEDPEVRDQLGQVADHVAETLREFRSILPDRSKPNERIREMDAETAERLRTLGYF